MGDWDFIEPMTDDPAGPKEIKAICDLLHKMIANRQDEDIPRIIGSRLKAWVERQEGGTR